MGRCSHESYGDLSQSKEALIGPITMNLGPPTWFINKDLGIPELENSRDKKNVEIFQKLE